jgi:hypothetical protein
VVIVLGLMTSAKHTLEPGDVLWEFRYRELDVVQPGKLWTLHRLAFQASFGRPHANLLPNVNRYQ